MAWSPLKTGVLTALAVVLFATNSILCRWALGGELIDPAGFTIVRLLSGVMILAIILWARTRGRRSSIYGNGYSGLLLFVYAVSFSFAFVTLKTGTGALILFGSVQITMITASILSGHRLHWIEWVGVGLAMTGFVYLVMPGIGAPPVGSLALMGLAGVSWGIYCVRGKKSTEALSDTAFNFMWTLPLVLALGLGAYGQMHLSFKGMFLAGLSGGIASGLGYTIWYLALAGLSGTQAAVVQLAVPLVAAGGGILFLSEKLTLRLALSSILILGGILLVIGAGDFFSGSRENPV